MGWVGNMPSPHELNRPPEGAGKGVRISFHFLKRGSLRCGKGSWAMERSWETNACDIDWDDLRLPRKNSNAHAATPKAINISPVEPFGNDHEIGRAHV